MKGYDLLPNLDHTALAETAGFIHAVIKDTVGSDLTKIVTRFPPEPNGCLHIGHAKSICLNFGMARLYGGVCNMRFDDTNPAKEDGEYVESILADVKWLGFDYGDRLFFASDYFDIFYDRAVRLIEKGLAYVCELPAEKMREYRGTLSAPGIPSPFRDRPAAESLELFARMRAGDFPDGAMTLRARIDMASPNINMRDPVIYRIARATHHRAGDKWSVYPMYDYAHPLEDAVEGVTTSLCTLEFEDHRPLYDWVAANAELPARPVQTEFAKLRLTNTIMGKRYMRELVMSGEVDGWDDPRLATLSGMRRRGYTPEAIRNFCYSVGYAKADSRTDISQLEHFVREGLKAKAPVVMAVLDPVKLIIDNYPEGQSETVTLDNHPGDASMGMRETVFSRELFIERGDYMEDAPRKFFRLSPGREVRLKGAYFVTATHADYGADGELLAVHATYDPATKSGSGFAERRPKGTIHWVSTAAAVPVTARLLDYLVYDDPASEAGVTKNPVTLTEVSAVAEPFAAAAKPGQSVQFMRNGYFCVDYKLTTPERTVFNRVVPLKSGYKAETPKGD
ncbi:MAG: glutamine--tRNA ligase/YqeY domain fusion protein [Clostridiales bacterium]|jgi:glutaminyl-tRNA synthetase|nr:glutamine--tRNA ligase/YqeY domain fusion protein [Clostridiales bacterium]